MIRELHIKNYKSIVDHRIELGRFNVFIGENGSGKTNLLEALAMASAADDDRLDAEALWAKGIRIAKPSITFSSFAGLDQHRSITIECVFAFNESGSPEGIRYIIDAPTGSDGVDAKWNAQLLAFGQRGAIDLTELDAKSPEEQIVKLKALARKLHYIPSDYAIYNADILALRGIQMVSRRAPLGIYGESLDVFLESLDPADRDAIVAKARIVSWFDDLEIDVADERKFQGHKLGRSTSTLYFRDRFMRPDNNVFSAENANEGILHILFYLALFTSAKTPKIFGIDNIETALNPMLCRELTKHLAALAKTNDKQALITTHNPAILDGLNLHDDDQRLFVVYRDDEGHTVTRRIQVKPDADGKRLKLSELWMRGHLGGLPKLF